MARSRKRKGAASHRPKIAWVDQSGHKMIDSFTMVPKDDWILIQDVPSGPIRPVAEFDESVMRYFAENPRFMNPKEILHDGQKRITILRHSRPFDEDLPISFVRRLDNWLDQLSDKMRRSLTWESRPRVRRTSKQPRAATVRPFLFVAALTSPREHRDALVGDLQERYVADCSNWGERKARFLLMRDVAVGIWPAAKDGLRRGFHALLKAGGFTYIAKHFFG